MRTFDLGTIVVEDHGGTTGLVFRFRSDAREELMELSKLLDHVRTEAFVDAANQVEALAAVIRGRE